MEHFYPKYYHNFKCIAADCPDSCCKGWDVVVDEESERYYSSIDGKIADKIKKVTVTDEDGDRIFALNEGKCPFWNNDKLCDIYISLGKEHLCKTCRNFPRITQDYGSFVEHSLSLACPEAARLILESDKSYESFCKVRESTDAEYDIELMTLLLETRQNTINILQENHKPFISRLVEAIEYNTKIQNAIDGTSDNYKATSDFGFIADVFMGLDYVDSEWKHAVEEINISPKNTHNELFEKIAEYYVYRYYLNAISSGYVLSTLKRIVCAYLIINSISEKYDFSAAVQQYSKEVEHSYENEEALEELFEYDGRFGALNIIENLKKLCSEYQPQNNTD